jgi:hypothetical protein
MRTPSSLLGLALVLAGTALAAPSAMALTSTRHYYQNASGICQSALPVFDGNIRKRPTAVANEGTANAFVSCSVPTNAESSLDITSFTVVLFNRTGADQTVSCTYVSSYSQVTSTLVPKSVTVPANDRAFLTFSTSDLPGPPSNLYFGNFSCNLLPGTDVGYIYYDYSVDVGA